jgi:hypothetical protein
MPSGKHFYSVGLGMKLASFMSVPTVHDVTTMDKLTNLELSRLILAENHLNYKDELGHLLSFIFRSYMNHIPKAEELTIPLKKYLLILGPMPCWTLKTRKPEYCSMMTKIIDGIGPCQHHTNLLVILVVGWEEGKMDGEIGCWSLMIVEQRLIWHQSLNPLLMRPIQTQN